MTEQTKVDVELHDEDINDIVEETLEEAEQPKGKGVEVKAPSEDESIASVDKASKATTKTNLPKTKAGMINAMYASMNKMNKETLTAAYAKVCEGLDVEPVVVAEKAVDTTSALEAMVENEATLSEEFKEKTAILFDNAVKSKLTEEVSRLEEQYKEELAEEVASIKENLVTSVDSYLNYVVETWMEDNKVAIQAGLRTEIAENFMTKLKDVFVESYIEVPETKVDLVDELAEQVVELEEKLNTTTGTVIAMTEELETYKRNSIISEACRDLADTQTEKLKGLVESIDFDSEEAFAKRVATIKESYFSKEIVEKETVLEDTDAEVEVSSSMQHYISTLRKTSKK